MRFLIFLIMISCFFRVCASDYTLLDASGGAWDGSGLFRRMLSEKVSLLPEKDSLALEKVSALPDKQVLSSASYCPQDVSLMHRL